MTVRAIHATTACFSGLQVRSALDRLSTGISEPQLGVLSTAHVQVCPQNFGCIDEAEADALREAYPNMQLRPHANARVWPVHVHFDASSRGEDAFAYFEALADRARRFGATALSIHAGFQADATLDQMIANVRRLQDEVFGDITLAVEGLYGNAHRPQLMDTWAEYEAVLIAGVPLAIDLSHLNIVATQDGRFQDDLVRALLASPTTLEVHLSANDGEKDAHRVLDHAPWWWSLLDAVGPNAVLFSEGNQMRLRQSASV